MVGIGTKIEQLICVTIKCRDPAMREAVKKEYVFLYNTTLLKRIEGENMHPNFSNFLLKYFGY